MAIKNWLDNSYARFGDSTSKSSAPKATKGSPAPDTKAKAAPAKAEKPTPFGNSSGGGKSSISNGAGPKDSKTKQAKGLMDGSVKANQKRGSY
ncbi:hypothetical protein [Paraburkholderia oxyphila]|uniref:hypothetical protein n=1 Tax=Paraburkholderia oxyphila TaxID=614212 RepID=UPI0012EE7C27|nr:hypothetical protein [Paraburkholderia oxyphila]